LTIANASANRSYFMTTPARHKPLTLSRLVRSEPDKHAPIRIANYQVDGHERRIANDLGKFVLVEEPWVHRFTRNGEERAWQAAAGIRVCSAAPAVALGSIAPVGFEMLERSH
jgi:hypothetical protein